MNIVPLASDDLASAGPCPLRAGPLSVLFDAGDLRYVKWGNHEVIRRIYATVRDRNWDTIPGAISELESRISESGFHIRYLRTHRQGDVHFVGRADIYGADDGSIHFTFDGEAKSTFLRNRIGFCVLHPIRECAGAVCRARYVNGTAKELHFPDTIAAEQPVKWLHDLVGLAHEVAPDVWAELEFTGDLFEMEDQRNWIDASFKTYGTPLRLPFPMEIQAGTRVHQEVRLRIVDRSRPTFGDTAKHSVVSVPSPQTWEQVRAIVKVRLLGTVTPLPTLGLGVASHEHPLLAAEANRLRTLRPAHLRVDLRLWEHHWPNRLARAAAEAGQLGAKLEVALHLDAAPQDSLLPAIEMLALRRDLLARMLVFHRQQRSTTSAALREARAALMDVLSGVPLGAGTDADLYQLNLQRPPADADFISWSMNPQVHAFDDTSIAETPEAVVHQLNSVHRYFPCKPRVVSPITLRPRFNPNATGPDLVVPPGELPPQVDPRQVSQFAAAWTLAMIKALAESGADSVTFYETTGWRGVMETGAGSTLSTKFPSTAGAVFPLYHVLADVGEFAGGEVVHTGTSDSLNVAPLCLRSGQRRRLMLANLSVEPTRISLQDFDSIIQARIMDASNRTYAMTAPEEFRAHSPSFQGTELELAPHAFATLDF